MSYSTIEEIRGDVNNYLESSIALTQFQALLTTAEDRIHSLVSIHDQKKELVDDISAGGFGLINLPDDFYGFVSV